MSSIVSDLKKLVSSKDGPKIGSVVSDSDDTVRIATVDGIKDMPKTSTYTYSQGDTVKIFNGVVVGKIKGDEDLPVYYV